MNAAGTAAPRCGRVVYRTESTANIAQPVESDAVSSEGCGIGPRVLGEMQCGQR